MADIVFSGDSDFSKIQKDFDDLSRRTARLEKENYRLKQSADKQADSFGKARGQQGSLLTQGISGITQMVAGYVSLQAAIQLVTSAIQEQRAAQKDTLDAQVSQAAADATLIQNLVGISAQQKKDTIATLENLTVDLGIESATAVKAGFNEAISKAAGDVDLAMDATKRAAELQRATPENLPTFAAGGAVLSKLIGTRDTREAYGLLSEVQARSPVSDPKELMAELPGALAAMTATDARGAGRESVREAAALMAAMGQATQQRAAPTSTASIQLTSQLEKFFKAGTADLDAKIAKLQDRAGKIAIGGVKGPHEEAAMADVKKQLREVRAEKAAVEVADPGTLAGRIEAIQKSQALQARILPTLTGEAKFLPAMRQLLEGRDSEITTQFRRNMDTGAEGGLQVGPQQFDVLAQELGGQSEVSAAVRAQATVAQRAARGEANKLADDTGAALAQIREEFSQAMGQSSRTWNQRLETGVLEKTFAAFQGGDPAEAAKLADELLMERIARIRNNEWTGVAGSIRMGVSGLKSDEELTPDEAQRVAALESSRLAIRRVAQEQAAPAAGAATVPPVAQLGTVGTATAEPTLATPETVATTPRPTPAPEPKRPKATAALRGFADWLLPGAALPENPEPQARDVTVRDRLQAVPAAVPEPPAPGAIGQARDVTVRDRLQAVPAAVPEPPAPGAIGQARDVTVRDRLQAVPAAVPEPPAPGAISQARDVTVRDRLQAVPAAVPEPQVPPGVDLTRRAAAATARPAAVREPTQRSPAGDRVAQTAAAAVDLSELKATNDQQLAELRATRKSIETMGERFARTAARLAGVAARAEANTV